MSKRKELEEALKAQRVVVRGLDARIGRLNQEYRDSSRKLLCEIGEERRKLMRIEREYGALMANKKPKGVIIWDDSFGIEKVENVYRSADECPCSISKQVFELVLEFGDYIKMGCIAGRPA